MFFIDIEEKHATENSISFVKSRLCKIFFLEMGVSYWQKCIKECLDKRTIGEVKIRCNQKGKENKKKKKNQRNLYMNRLNKQGFVCLAGQMSVDSVQQHYCAADFAVKVNQI